MAKGKRAAAASSAATSSSTAAAAGQDSEARRFFSGANRRAEAPATIGDVVHVLEHLGIAGAPVSRGEPEDED